MAATQYANVRVLDERLAFQVRLHQRRNIDGEVDAPRGQFDRHGCTVDLMEEETHARSLRREFSRQRRRERRCRHVAGSDIERALRELWFEALTAVEAGTQPRHRVPHRPDQLLGFRRRRHAAA